MRLVCPHRGCGQQPTADRNKFEKSASSPSLPIALLSCHFYIPFLLMDRSVPTRDVPHSCHFSAKHVQYMNYPLYCRTLVVIIIVTSRCNLGSTTHKICILQSLNHYGHMYMHIHTTYLHRYKHNLRLGSHAACSNQPPKLPA